MNATLERYLGSDDNAEFRDGKIVPLDESSLEHGIILANVTVAIGNRLANSSCTTMCSVRFRAIGDEFLCPDVAVICGPPARTANGRAVTNPTLVIEVLSPSTADYDYGGKFELYRTIESLLEYCLVSQSRPRVEVYRRTPTGEWLLSTYIGLDKSVPFPSLGIEAPMTEIYANIQFD